MKSFAKLSTALLAAAVLVSGAAHAQATQVITAATAKNLSDEMPVTIKGKIIRKLAKESYELQDASGKVRVDIDDDETRGSNIIGKTVTITGELDKKRDGSVEIETDYLQIH
ncbi:NirD/YgiW/YdeI family stress tolerance protein [Moraxella sp. FZFQ2102]|uniref:NirD/YgiW/YdeI family stress tolerance protein n=1 Tax=Moraxella sp. FZFQ2102 TaxID=2953752 RepID=UPI00209C6008|nr:NirD/YgiW/YdeI family stress tolerance protein [Moraxella sp. FZFQ2102]USZ13962.1 NirD/YgiW/YdeI family stress tolerance protein [Moraxella sp. FZFQ2102]